MLRKIDLFPTPLYCASVVGGEKLNKVLGRDIYAWNRADPEGVPRSNGGSSWHSHVRAWERPAFSGLMSAVMNAAAEVFRNTEYKEDSRVMLSEMWANIQNAGGWNAPHSHGRSLWSGVYYVSCPPGSGSIVFLDPRRQGEVHIEVPKAGDMLLFPGRLEHYVEPHVGMQPRLSVSFNLDRQVINVPRPRPRSYIQVPGLLTLGDITRIYSQISKLEWGKGLVGSGVESPMRVNQVLFVNGGSSGEWGWLYDKVYSQAKIVNETFGLDITGGGDIQFARYGPGGKYDEHTDRGPEAPTRSLSCSISLRPAVRGGGINFPNSAYGLPEHQAAGDAVFFPATEAHAALPVEEGVRDSLIFWFKDGGDE